MCGFSLASIPKHAIITSAKISFYPMNRVSVQVESYGEWRVGQVDMQSIGSLHSFEDIKNAKMLSYIDRPTGSAQLSQGIWRTYQFARQEIEVLQSSLKKGEALFRMEGPSTLPLDRGSQLMQWDIGYGAFSGGLTFRPKLDISYTIEDAKLELLSCSEMSITKDGVTEDNLCVGYDTNGDKMFGCLEFDLSNLPKAEDTTISNAYIDLETDSINALNNLRFHIEMVVPCEGKKSYDQMKKREVIERIGYDVSASDIKNQTKQRFVFDRYAIEEMLQRRGVTEKAYFVLSASSENPFAKAQSIHFVDEKRLKRPSLVINYMKKHQHPPKPVENLQVSIQNGMFKLTWDMPDDKNITGFIVVKNPFKVPCSPYDGQKLYGGTDRYTFDNFGDLKVHKYYAVFSYDDVPNFSEAAVVEVNSEIK